MDMDLNPGQIKVTGKFIDGSTSTGLLMIVANSEHDVRYHIYSRNGDETDVQDTMSGLTRGNYIVSTFVMEENGLPFSRTATIPRNVTVNNGKYDLLQYLSYGIGFPCEVPISLVYCYCLIHDGFALFL